jgi:hypothetical protein
MSQCHRTFWCQLSFSSKTPIVSCIQYNVCLTVGSNSIIVQFFRRTQICGNGLLVKSNRQRLSILILYVIPWIPLLQSLSNSLIASVLTTNFCPNRYLLLSSRRSWITWASTLPQRPDQHLVNHGWEGGMTREVWMDPSMETSDEVLGINYV